jgi:BASS family bile acid:Na+ symporter
VRNIGLAVMIKASMFPATTGPAAQVGDMVLFTLIIYGGFQLLVGGILVGYYRRRRVPAD